MPFNSARACPEEGRKSFPFPCFRRALDKAEKSPGSFLDWTSRGKFPGHSYIIYYKERFYTAP